MTSETSLFMDDSYTFSEFNDNKKQDDLQSKYLYHMKKYNNMDENENNRKK